MGPTCSSKKTAGNPLESPACALASLGHWEKAQRSPFCCLWSPSAGRASSVPSTDRFLHPLQSSHHHLFQGFLCRLFEDTATRVKIWWWSTCVLTIRCLLLLVLMFSAFPCDYFFCVASLLLSLWMQITSGMLLIFLQLIKRLWGRREHEVCFVSFEFFEPAILPAVYSYSCNKWVRKRVADLYLKNRRKNPQNSEKIEIKGSCFFFFFPRPHNCWKNKKLLTLGC